MIYYLEIFNKPTISRSEIYLILLTFLIVFFSKIYQKWIFPSIPPLTKFVSLRIYRQLTHPSWDFSISANIF